MANAKTRRIADKAAKYFLLIMAISFLGWAFETSVVFFETKRFYNQGFMKLPFCPIYGCSVLAVYFLLGVPKKSVAKSEEEKGGGVLLKRISHTTVYYVAYLLFAFLIPSVAELIVGAFFDRLFSVRLWSYRSYPLHINGYVCLPVSLVWMGLIFVFMRYFFTPLKRSVFRLPDVFAASLALLLLFAVACDMTLQYLAL
ncbi:MAG: putative ABC transporter permease [Clostridia bacterium]|nr:putative ABC transporter permease [Clostridia bacterium]